MIYTSDWWLLEDALNGVIAASGGDERQAKVAICRALIDRKIRIRACVRSHYRDFDGRTVEDQNISISRYLEPNDLDWIESRPLNPARIVAYYGGWNEPIDLIELRAADIIELFCRRPPEPRTARGTKPVIAATPRKRGVRPTKLEQTKEVMRSKLRENPDYLQELDAAPEKVLEADFGVSRDTARKARNAVLSEIAGKSNPDK